MEPRTLSRILLVLLLPSLMMACSTTKTRPTAKVLAVAPSGSTTSYQFAVTLQTPDKGCDQYADWWELVDENGKLIYRRVLAHPHVDEQPFTRSGGPVAIGSDKKVYVRVHMNNSGYSREGMVGSVAEGFEEETLDEGFAADVASKPPQPQGCN